MVPPSVPDVVWSITVRRWGKNNYYRLQIADSISRAGMSEEALEDPSTRYESFSLQHPMSHHRRRVSVRLQGKDTLVNLAASMGRRTSSSDFCHWES